MSWDQAARTAAIRVKPTEEWEIELIGERAWEVAFIEGARWQRKHAGEEMSDMEAIPSDQVTISFWRFDRMLKLARKEAWREGYDAGFDDACTAGLYDDGYDNTYTPSPYQEGNK